ncbi:MAG: hypothetical protein Alpg2KO_05420 [Alphaproteobacteria bacterium]
MDMKSRNILRKRGISLTGYGLIVGLIAVVGIAATTQIGSSVTALFDETSDTLQTAQTGSGAGSASPGSSQAPSPTPTPDILLTGSLTQGDPSIWADGTRAEDCSQYLNPPVGYDYAGSPSGTTGSGFYAVDTPTNGQEAIYCEMDEQGGGWTRIATNASANGAVEYLPIAITDRGIVYTELWIERTSGGSVYDSWATPATDGVWDWQGWNRRRNTLRMSDGNFYSDVNAESPAGADDYIPQDLGSWITLARGTSAICYFGSTNQPNDLSKCANEIFFTIPGGLRVTGFHDLEGNPDGGDTNNSFSQTWHFYVR